MYLYCYSRSQRARTTGNSLLKVAQGEWVSDCESMIASLSDTSGRADSAIVLFLPPEAAVKILIERLYAADIRCPVFRVSPDGGYAEVMKGYGYNTYEILSGICSALGCRPLSSKDDRADYAPDLTKAVAAYNMTVDNEQLLKEINEYVMAGGTVNIYTDLPIHMTEPVLDTVSYVPFAFRYNQVKEMGSAYTTMCASDQYSVFITCSVLPEVPDRGRCLVLIPKTVVIGVEVQAKADPGYATEAVRNALSSHQIAPEAVCTVAVTAVAREHEAVAAISDDLGCFITAYDSRLLKAVRLPLQATYSPQKVTSDMCTAAACVASDNGRVLFRRSGQSNTAIVTACMKRGNIIITE